MQKLQFFDVPVFLQKIRERMRNNASSSTAYRCWDAAYELNRRDITEAIEKTHPESRIDLPKEKYLVFCEEEWVDDLIVGVEAIVNQNTKTNA